MSNILPYTGKTDSNNITYLLFQEHSLSLFNFRLESNTQAEYHHYNVQESQQKLKIETIILWKLRNSHFLIKKGKRPKKSFAFSAI